MPRAALQDELGGEQIGCIPYNRLEDYVEGDDIFSPGADATICALPRELSVVGIVADDSPTSQGVTNISDEIINVTGIPREHLAGWVDFNLYRDPANPVQLHEQNGLNVNLLGSYYTRYEGLPALTLILQEYVNQNLEFRLQNTEKTLAWLTQEVAKQQLVVQASERTLAEYRERKNALSLEDRQNIIVASRLIEADLRNDLLAHVQQLSARFFVNTPHGELMAYATNDIDAVRFFIGPSVMYTADTLTTFLAAFGFMLALSPMLAFSIIIPLPLMSSGGSNTFSVFMMLGLVNNVRLRRIVH